MKRAVVPGTFDPITEGHLDIIRRASQIFDEIVVGVAESAAKSPLFSLDERVSLVHQSVEGMPNVRVEPFTGLLVDFVREMQAGIVVKGLRAITDFEYEFQMTSVNYKLGNDIETLFIMSPPQFMYLSSSVVREIASMDGPVDDFVTPCVREALQRKFGLERASS